MENNRNKRVWSNMPNASLTIGSSTLVIESDKGIEAHFHISEFIEIYRRGSNKESSISLTLISETSPNEYLFRIYNDKGNVFIDLEKIK